MSLEIREFTPRKRLLDLNLAEFWRYRDLLILFVKRDFISVYKQTILGPLWFFLQPIFTTLMFTLIFGKLAEIPTDGTPPFLFYLAGITLWNYFSECFSKTSNTFVTNSDLFGKVYFPRLIVPSSIILSNLLKFGVQFLLFLVVYSYYTYESEFIEPNVYILLLPLLIMMMAFSGLGLGLIISALTTKYRDLQFLMGFVIQLFMYATPVVYPLSLAKERLGAYYWITYINPISPIIEVFKYGFLGNGNLDWIGLTISFCFSIVILFLGVIIFNKVERAFMDTV